MFVHPPIIQAPEQTHWEAERLCHGLLLTDARLVLIKQLKVRPQQRLVPVCAQQRCDMVTLNVKHLLHQGDDVVHVQTLISTLQH